MPDDERTGLREREARAIGRADGEIPDAGLYHDTIKAGRFMWQAYVSPADAAIAEIEAEWNARAGRR